MPGYLPHGGVRPTDQTFGTVTLLLSGPDSAPGMAFECPVNPAEITIDRPSRQSVTQTLTGAYQDHLGSGLIHVQMRGHTGWRRLRPQFADGFEAYKALRGLLYEYDQRVAGGDPSKVFLRLLLDIPSGWEHFRVSKDEARYSRSRSQPLLFAYDLAFTVLRDELAGEPVDPSPPFVITFNSTPQASFTIVPKEGDDSSNAGDGGDGSGSGKGDGTKPDPDPVTVPGPVANTFAYTENMWDIVSTVRGLAVFWYGPLGFHQPELLWDMVANANQDILGFNATAATSLPHFINPSFNSAPDRPRQSFETPTFQMPILNAQTWNNLVDANVDNSGGERSFDALGLPKSQVRQWGRGGDVTDFPDLVNIAGAAIVHSVEFGIGVTSSVWNFLTATSDTTPPWKRDASFDAFGEY